MSRFFVEPSQVSEEGYITITGSDVKHMKDVLRMNKGDNFTVCDSTGTEYICSLESFSDGCALGNILSGKAGETEPKTPCVLMQGVPKGDKMELIIQKNVELGVNRIIPVMMERCVVRFNNDKDKEKKCERWNRIAVEASKQCGRLSVPVVEKPVSLKEAMAMVAEAHLKIVPYENEDDLRLKAVLRNKNPQSVAFIVGPEGGFAESEISLLKEKGFTSVSLGKRILRTETAGFAVMSAIRYELED